ncbi:unnamed protein product [Orchesella dallaii]|uniref:C2H2-type domain-containing protein n=1 Tax=Orchesella dallaii TaxID=48710 RepID=A0ABP1Q2Q1_9HEXA
MDQSIRPRTIGVDNIIQSIESSFEGPLNDNDANQETVQANNQPTNVQQIQALLPQPFRSTVNDATSKVIKVQMMTPRPLDRPNGYIEPHIFRPAEPAYIIAKYNGRLGVVQGRITECYTNFANITLYVIDVSSHSTLEYHMPRFLCFHYPEDAVFVLQHHISEEERNMIIQYCTPYASREVAMGLQYNLSEGYAEMILNLTRPITQCKQRNFPGPVAIGLPPSRLEQVDSDEETDDEKADEQCHGETLPKIHSLSRLTKRRRISNAQVDAEAPGETTEHELLPKKKRGAVAEQCIPVPERAVVMQPVADAPAYDSFFRREFGTTSDNLHNVSLMRRNLESAKENITWFVTSRTPYDVDVNYNDLYDQVASVLHYYYYETRLNQRRFLTASHYNVANETNHPGSSSRFVCSFCNIKFNDDEPLRHHYHTCHSIVAIYKCLSCEQQFLLPSLFRLHIFTCDSTLGLNLILNINLSMMDAFADYLGSRAVNNTPKHVLQPGLPNFTRVARKFKVQSSYKNILKDWPVLAPIDNALNPTNQQVNFEEDSDEDDANVEDAIAQDYDVEDANAQDSDEPDSEVEDSDVEDSEVEDSDEDDSEVEGSDVEEYLPSSNPRRPNVSIDRSRTSFDKQTLVTKGESWAHIAKAEELEVEVELEQPRRVTRAVAAKTKRS